MKRTAYTPDEKAKMVEDIYLKNYDRPADARKGLDEYLRYYNDRRYHSSLGYQTPSEVYFQS